MNQKSFAAQIKKPALGASRPVTSQENPMFSPRMSLCGLPERFDEFVRLKIKAIYASRGFQLVVWAMRLTYN